MTDYTINKQLRIETIWQIKPELSKATIYASNGQKVTLFGDEIVPMISALTSVAAGMGIPTAQGELLALLRETEWRMGACFWCGRSKKDGHSPDCKLGQALAKAQQ